jgi:hypothetical protein
LGKPSFIAILSSMRHAAWIALLNWFDARGDLALSIIIRARRGKVLHGKYEVKLSEPLEASAVDGDTYGDVWGGY